MMISDKIPLEALEVAAALDLRIAEYAEACRQHVLDGGTQTDFHCTATGGGERLKAMARAMHWQSVTIDHPDADDFRELALLAWNEAGRNGLVAC